MLQEARCAKPKLPESGERIKGVSVALDAKVPKIMVKMGIDMCAVQNAQSELSRKMTIVTLNSVCLSWSDTFEVVALFPQRTFRRSVHVLLWPHESWFNVQYLKLFRDCDREDVEVVVHCSRNFLPIASLIGHRIIMQKTRNMQSSVFSPNSRMSMYGFDWKLQQREWRVEHWELGFQRTRSDFESLPVTCGEVIDLLESFVDKPLVIEQAALTWFDDHRSLLPDSATDFELKCRWSGPLIEKINNLGDPTLLGSDKRFQHDLIAKHGCDQFFLSVQLLVGLCKHWSFVGLHGAASVFSLLAPVNLLLAMDPDNLTREMLTIRSICNRRYYGVPTVGRPDAGRDFATRLAVDSKMFQETIVEALDNRQYSRWPSVHVRPLGMEG